MEKFTQSFQRQEFQIRELLFFFVLMTALSVLGGRLSEGDLGFNTVWPPCGLFFAALTFAPNLKRDWPRLCVTAAIANLIYGPFIEHFSPLVTVCFIVIDTLSAMSAAWLARRLLLTSRSINGLRGMVIFLGCGLLIQSSLAATSGLWLQGILWNKPWTWLRWVAWWSANAIGISCFGIISFYFLQKFSATFFARNRENQRDLIHWVTLDGTRTELALLWMTFFVISLLLHFSLMPPWGLFILNVLFLAWSFRFGILHSSTVLAISCIFRIYMAVTNWHYLTPFSQLLFLRPPTSQDALKVATIVSFQLFLIERSVVVNFAAALFTDLHLKQRALVDAAASRERLMARMSHEIRTPLSGVLGLVEAWALKEQTPQRSHDLQMILNSGAQLKRVIDDVLDFAKLSAGKMLIEPQKCHVRDLFSEIVSLHVKDAQGKGLSLELTVAENLDEEILVDSVRLRQIMNNLIANAVKFTEKGFVRVHVEPGLQSLEHHRVLRLTVEDTGIGISPIALKNIFQPFEQIGTETTRAYGGTGLGLAICRELTELLGGHIAVESTRGVGTLFTVEIPYDRAERSTAGPMEGQTLVSPPSASVTTNPSRKKGQVLIVEDDLINQIVASRFLEAEGFSVKVVDNGMQALEILQQHADDFVMVLMDYFMPAMDGCEVTRRYRADELKIAHGSHLPIVGLTASILEVDHQRCRQAGMDDVLLKPLERTALRTVLSKHTAA